MLQMYFKLSSPIQEGNLLVLLIKIRLFFTLVGSARIAEFLCVLRELYKGSLLLSVSNTASHVARAKQTSYFWNILWIGHAQVNCCSSTPCHFQLEIKETFIFCVPPQLHWALLKLPVHTVALLISSGKISPVGSFFSSFVLVPLVPLRETKCQHRNQGLFGAWVWIAAITI